MDRRGLGNFGEERAARYLRLHGYTILERNFRCRQGEIDIIARRLPYLVFVEVKLRKNADHGEAMEFVNAAKQQRIIQTAQLWLSRNETELQPRFDIIEVYAPLGEKGPVRVVHRENAFY